MAGKGWLVAVVGVAVLLVGCSSSPSGSGGINPGDQDPDCHRAALAVASSEPDFEWNGTGMDRYRTEYESCLKAADVLGG
jgi:hypothetical protein